jgi:hypothetical protein
LGEGQIADLRRFVFRFGEEKACRVLQVSSTALLRALAGLAVQRGTAALIDQRMPEVRRMMGDDPHGIDRTVHPDPLPSGGAELTREALEEAARQMADYDARDKRKT